MSDDQTTAPGDGTFTCTWCGRRFPVDVAIPDDNDELPVCWPPICPQCDKDSRDDETQTA